MELRDIRYILTIIRHANISHAAQVLHVPQPTLSNALHRVEKELGQPLLERVSRGLKVLPAGERFALYAEDILDIEGRMLTELSSQQNGSRPQKIISVGFEPFHLHMFSQIVGYKSIQPYCKFDLQSARPDALLEGLRNGSLAFAVMCTPHNLDGLDHFPLRKVRVFAVCSPTSPICHLARRDRTLNSRCLYITALRGQNLLIPKRNDPLACAMDHYLSKNHIPYTINVNVDNATTACMLAIQNMGVAIIPDPFLCGPFFSGLEYFRLKDLNKDLNIEVSLVFSAKPQPRMIRDCIEYCRDQLQEQTN